MITGPDADTVRRWRRLATSTVMPLAIVRHYRRALLNWELSTPIRHAQPDATESE